MAHEQEHHQANGAGYEVEDASIREVVLTGVGLAIGTIVVCFAVYGLLKVMNTMDAAGRVPLTQIPTQEVFPPGPRLQEKPWEELQVLRSQEDQRLTTYGWVDKNSGHVRIPVERAMELVMQKGLPARAEGASRGSAVPKTSSSQPANIPTQASPYPSKGAKGGQPNAPQR